MIVALIMCPGRLTVSLFSGQREYSQSSALIMERETGTGKSHSKVRFYYSIPIAFHTIHVPMEICLGQKESRLCFQCAFYGFTFCKTYIHSKFIKAERFCGSVELSLYFQLILHLYKSVRSSAFYAQ